VSQKSEKRDVGESFIKIKTPRRKKNTGSDAPYVQEFGAFDEVGVDEIRFEGPWDRDPFCSKQKVRYFTGTVGRTRRGKGLSVPPGGKMCLWREGRGVKRSP